jgi:hypothetical protein
MLRPASLKANSAGTVAHTYNPSYSGGRDRESHGSRKAKANSKTLSQPIDGFTVISAMREV